MCGTNTVCRHHRSGSATATGGVLLRVGDGVLRSTMTHPVHSEEPWPELVRFLEEEQAAEVPPRYSHGLTV